MRILIVEDDEVLADGLSVGLRLSGFTPDQVATIADARDAIEADDFDGIVLDIIWICCRRSGRRGSEYRSYF